MHLPRYLPCALAIAWSAGCGVCDCSPTGIQFNVSPDARGKIAAVEVSGAACAGETPDCFDELYTRASEGMCAILEIHPKRVGSCHMQVDFTDGTRITKDFTFAESNGCCAGISLHDAPDSTVINRVSGGTDAGAH